MHWRSRKREVTYAPTVEIERRSREVQLLMNVVEPDPEYQAFFLSDEASILDICGADQALIERRLEAYFGVPFPCPLNAPLWQVVDRLKQMFPQWPDGWPPDAQ